MTPPVPTSSLMQVQGKGRPCDYLGLLLHGAQSHPLPFGWARLAPGCVDSTAALGTGKVRMESSGWGWGTGCGEVVAFAGFILQHMRTSQSPSAEGGSPAPLPRGLTTGLSQSQNKCCHNS